MLAEVSRQLAAIAAAPALARLALTAIRRPVVTPNREARNPSGLRERVAGRRDDEHWPTCPGVIPRWPQGLSPLFEGAVAHSGAWESTRGTSPSARRPSPCG